MGRPKGKSSESTLDEMLGEASWLLSHAEALADYGRESLSHPTIFGKRK